MAVRSILAHPILHAVLGLVPHAVCECTRKRSHPASLCRCSCGQQWEGSHRLTA